MADQVYRRGSPCRYRDSPGRIGGAAPERACTEIGDIHSTALIGGLQKLFRHAIDEDLLQGLPVRCDPFTTLDWRPSQDRGHARRSQELAMLLTVSRSVASTLEMRPLLDTVFGALVDMMQPVQHRP